MSVAVERKLPEGQINTIHDIPAPPPKECCLMKWWHKKTKHVHKYSQWDLDYIVHVRANSTLNGKKEGS